MSEMTPFAEILRDVVGAVPGALGAVFSDWDGEPVDQFALLEPLDIQLLGAHVGLVLNDIKRATEAVQAGAAGEIIIRAERAQLLLHVVDAKYYVVLALTRDAPTAWACRALASAADRLRREM
jgi:predicted regulator of Ras-like GTPase activity (Roadblock/LC7/MglB family)